MKVVVIVQARMGSRRLTGKALMPVAGRPMLGHLIDRLRQVHRADGIVVATSAAPDDDAIVSFCESQAVAVFRGSEEDVLSRYAAAAKYTCADVVVRVTADCPLIDPAIVDRVIGTYLTSRDLQFVSNTIERTYPRGMDVEVFSRAILEEAQRCAVDPYDREHVTPFIRRALEGSPLVCNVAGDQPLNKYRITVDYPSDYENVKALVESGLSDFL
ncbi:cytidylyltransferase domain-containing protein [Massilia putida]|uniref:cytidylyltransferase domain-containing protein n=1 Tax=Massilia putida TaxID=1141883 RepID=UPI0012EC87FB|nr:glycosyltransferase family protein [Massilia putida]